MFYQEILLPSHFSSMLLLCFTNIYASVLKTRQIKLIIIVTIIILSSYSSTVLYMKILMKILTKGCIWTNGVKRAVNIPTPNFIILSLSMWFPSVACEKFHWGPVHSRANWAWPSTEHLGLRCKSWIWLCLQSWPSSGN